ncbi:hypothetical protein BAS1294 [Bacillus anthracis str. Sterne]|uniref:Uncharacterized protein n=1 Tax=Bacillus thuringiensis subsp. konkukian (strain 97-27) TaxID=281309 RepID=Q6HLH0_BACHK|nr:hypothetical protein BAS1294 [Bacillus anthracis str. Sterne]AAT59407.1 hypothetical protein BT9727_1266 [[Bacillus thuringiensis] serovar konkukian str. 97-27]
MISTSNTAAKMVIPIKNEVFLYLGGLCTSCRYPGEISGANSSSNDCFFSFSSICIHLSFSLCYTLQEKICIKKTTAIL